MKEKLEYGINIIFPAMIYLQIYAKLCEEGNSRLNPVSVQILDSRVLQEWSTLRFASVLSRDQSPPETKMCVSGV